MTEQITGGWHVLDISWYDTNSDAAWVAHHSTPVPDDVEPEYIFDLHHPIDCGEGCHQCGHHNHCNILFDVMETSWEDLVGDMLTPGRWVARHHLEFHRSYFGETEVNSWLEMEPYSADDERVQGIRM